jgi:hypothetical protein
VIGGFLPHGLPMSSTIEKESLTVSFSHHVD